MIAQVYEYATENWPYLSRLILEHLGITGTAMALAMAVAIPTGVLLTRLPGIDSAVIGLVGVFQTIPSMALLAVMIPFLGIGFKPAVAALFIYALLPIVRNTYIGVKEVTPELIEAARGMGMTRFQVLTKVQIPIALPVIVGGVRTATVICVGTATLAALIGSGGLGSLIYRGLQQLRMVFIVTGAVFAAILALGLDGCLGVAEWLITPRGLRGRRGRQQAL